jgi:hypothetical protein
MKVVELFNGVLVEEDRIAPVRSKQICDLLSLQIILGEIAWPANANNLDHLLLLSELE